MSYEITLRPTTEKLTRAAFVDLFKQRLHWSFPKEDPDVAAYYSTQTGVYFHFRFRKASRDEPTGALGFSINVYRHPMFACEADLVLQELTAQGKFSVEDGQREGIAGNNYSSDQFRRGWTWANQFAYQRFGNDEEIEPPLTYDGSAIQAAWAWNYKISELKQQYANHAVPWIRFARVEDQVHTIAEWRSDIDGVLPQTDLVVVKSGNVGAVLRWAPVAQALGLQAAEGSNEPWPHWTMYGTHTRADGAALIERPRLAIQLTMLDPADVHALQDVHSL